MAWWGQPKQSAPVHVDGPRGSVLVTGLGYKLKDLPRAFGDLGELTESDFEAVLKPMPPNQYNRTPIEVWVNGVQIGCVNDTSSPAYWGALRNLKHEVSCTCVVKTTALRGDYGIQVGKVRLSLPPRL